MNGPNILVDTNIVLYLLDGDERVADYLSGKVIYVSFITELELLGYQALDENEISKIEGLLANCFIIDTNEDIKKATIEIKRKYNIKLPDAIIAATAQYLNFSLFSADKGFDKIEDLQFIKHIV